ncbi:unnamed protein product [Ixodes hexagonus]
MANCAPYVTLLLCFFLSGGVADHLVGGWGKKDPNSNPHYLELAHYAVSTLSKHHRYYDTVVALTDLVAGVNYKLTYTFAESTCKVGEVKYSPKWCRPKTKVRTR